MAGVASVVSSDTAYRHPPLLAIGGVGGQADSQQQGRRRQSPQSHPLSPGSAGGGDDYVDEDDTPCSAAASWSSSSSRSLLATLPQVCASLVGMGGGGEPHRCLQKAGALRLSPPPS